LVSSANIFTEVNEFTADISIIYQSSTSAKQVFWVNISRDTNPRLECTNNGNLNWGSESAASNIEISRSSAKTLLVDNSRHDIQTLFCRFINMESNSSSGSVLNISGHNNLVL
jgi:hypothetical protein